MSALCRGAFKTSIVELILDLGLLEKVEDSCPFLTRYSEFGGADVARKLVEAGVDPEKEDRVGRTPLVAAVERHNYPVAKVLLEAGASPEARSLDWPLIVMSGSYLNCLLLERGADIDAPNETGVTALMMAAGGGDSERAELLLENGANPDLQDERGRTALMHALSGDVQYVEGFISAEEKAVVAPVLLEAGADPTITDKLGRTALDYAEEHGLSEMAGILREKLGVN